MNKKLKMALLIAIPVFIVGVLVVGGLVWYFIVPPSSEKLCDHVYDLTEKELVAQLGEEAAKTYLDSAAKDDFMDSCIEEADKRVDEIGMVKAAKEGKCIQKADNFEELEKCEEETEE